MEIQATDIEVGYTVLTGAGEFKVRKIDTDSYEDAVVLLSDGFRVFVEDESTVEVIGAEANQVRPGWKVQGLGPYSAPVINVDRTAEYDEFTTLYDRDDTFPWSFDNHDEVAVF